MTTGYSERELVTNRAPVLAWGGREEERHAWAEEAAQAFASEGPLRVAATVEAVKAAIGVTRGVVYVPDAVALGDVGQGFVLQALGREERAKWVLGLPSAPQKLLATGELRDDLHYRLQLGQLDLGPNEVRETIRARRQAAALARKAEAKPAPAKSAKPAGTKPNVLKTVAAKPSTAKKPAEKAAPRRTAPAAKARSTGKKDARR